MCELLNTCINSNDYYKKDDLCNDYCNLFETMLSVKDIQMYAEIFIAI